MHLAIYASLSFGHVDVMAVLSFGFKSILVQTVVEAILRGSRERSPLRDRCVPALLVF